MAGPEQVTPALANDGVTTTDAITGKVPELVAIKDWLIPEPVASNPILGSLLAHE